MMQLHAVGPLEFRCAPYAIYWGVYGWTAWNWDKRVALLVKDASISEALAKCEEDLALQTT